MPRSKTGAGPGLNGAFSPPKKIKTNPRPGQNLVLKIDWTGANKTQDPAQDQGCTGHFISQTVKEIRNNPRLGQNSVLKIDWTGAYFGLGQILAQNNPKLGQN